MQRWETMLALLAVVLASAAAFPLGLRMPLAIIAIILLITVGVARLRSHNNSRRSMHIPDAANRAARIREEREDRLHH